MKIPQVHIAASEREIEKCSWLLNHIKAMEVQTGNYTDPSIGMQKHHLQQRVLEHTAFIQAIKIVSKVQAATKNDEVASLKLDMKTRDLRTNR